MHGIDVITIAPLILLESLAEVGRCAALGEGGVRSACDKKGFQVSISVHQFQPNEVNVKVRDNAITIEAKHAERREGHEHISRLFTRSYMVPMENDINNVNSTMSIDGILTVKTPKVKEGNQDNECNSDPANWPGASFKKITRPRGNELNFH